MKRFILTLAGSMTMAGAAFAEQVTVQIPADVKSPAGAQAYTAALDHAVETVCRRQYQPLVGNAWYNYRACVKSTKADVAAKEPTGIYASRFSDRPSLAMAAK